MRKGINQILQRRAISTVTGRRVNDRVRSLAQSDKTQSGINGLGRERAAQPVYQKG